jgi:hypothetical protein
MPRELPLMPILDVANDPPQISLDGQSVLLSLVGAGGVRIPLQFRLDALGTMVSRLSRAQLLAESVVAAQRGDVPMQTVPVDRVTAQAPHGAPFVALTVLTHLPLLQHFEVEPTQAEALATELRSAAVLARNNKDASRH